MERFSLKDGFGVTTFGIALITVMLCVLCVGGMMATMVYYNAKQCDRYAELDPVHNYDFAFFGGCYVQSDAGRWVPINQYIGITQ
jgi:hypothetical protein